MENGAISQGIVQNKDKYRDLKNPTEDSSRHGNKGRCQREQGSGNDRAPSQGRSDRSQRNCERAFAAALKQVDKSKSECESETKHSANIATADPGDSDEESDDSSESGKLRAHAACIYSCFKG